MLQLFGKDPGTFIQIERNIDQEGIKGTYVFSGQREKAEFSYVPKGQGTV